MLRAIRASLHKKNSWEVDETWHEGGQHALSIELQSP